MDVEREGVDERVTYVSGSHTTIASMNCDTLSS